MRLLRCGYASQPRPVAHSRCPDDSCLGYPGFTPPAMFTVPVKSNSRFASTTLNFLLIIVTLSFTFPPAATQANIGHAAVNDGDVPVLTFFYSDWCQYCRQQKPVIAGIEAEYAGSIRFVYINAGEDQEAIKEWGVETIPTIVLTENEDSETEYARFEGLTAEETLRSGLDSLLSGTGKQ